MATGTADLCDVHGDVIQVVDPGFRNFGARPAFFGTITTVLAPDDNSWVRAVLDEPGAGRVVVVDGGGSMRCALLGDQLATLAVKNAFAGLIVNGCVRDSHVIRSLDLGVKALGTHPRKSVKRNGGARDLPVTFGSVTFTPGHWLYADDDGIIVSATPLHGP